MSVDEIVAVAPDVVAFIDDQRPQAQLPRTALREHAPGDARADDRDGEFRMDAWRRPLTLPMRCVPADRHRQLHAGSGRVSKAP